MKVALVGQPNSGKSTVFNAVAGYRSLTSNFAGTTVEYTRGQARVGGVVLDLIDLPGLYSLMPTTAVEEVSRNYLLNGEWDVIINVVDASQMARSLELTLELLDLESPLVVCLNMMDEAARKGMTIDSQALSAALRVPVVEAIGGRGRGIAETFRAAQDAAINGAIPRPFPYARDLEIILEHLAEKIAENDQPPTSRRQSVFPVIPSSPLPATNVKCLGGCCNTSCGGQVLAGSGTHLESTHHAVQHVSAGIAVAEPATSSPAKRSSTDLHDKHLQSPIANHQSSIAAFPPARFRALQLLQSEPDQRPKYEALAAVGVLTSDLRLRTSDFPASHSPLTTSHFSSGPGLASVDWARAEIAARTGQPADAAISSARHAACLNLFEQVAHVAKPKSDWRERIDLAAMHPIWGYVLLAAVFLGFFRLIFDVGKLGEDRILAVFDAVVALLTRHMDPASPLFAAVKGARAGHGGSRGDCAALPAAVSGRPRDSGRHWLPLARGLSDGRGDAPAGAARHRHAARAGGLRMQRSGGHGDENSHHPARPLHRRVSGRPGAVLRAHDGDLRAGGILPGRELRAGNLRAEHHRRGIIGNVLARIWPEISPGMLMEVPAYRVPGAQGGGAQNLVAPAGVRAGGVSAAGGGQHGSEPGGFLRLAASASTPRFHP